MAKFQYLTNCTLVPMCDVDDLLKMTDAAVDVTHSTFCKQCDWHGMADDLGYAIGATPGLHLKDDWHVSYHKSHFKGAPCFYVKHSAIEHIFTA